MQIMLTNQAIQRLKNVIKKYKDEEFNYTTNNKNLTSLNYTNNISTVKEDKNLTSLNITNNSDHKMIFKQVENKE